jgi:hypothetical protein
MGYDLQCCTKVLQKECVEYSIDCINIAKDRMNELWTILDMLVIGMGIAVISVVIAWAIGDCLERRKK